MSGTDELRAALGTDADTPAGVDVGAVRDRARTLRRRRTTLLAGTAAVLTVAAIVVPAGILGRGGSGPDTGPVAAPAGTTPAPLACPDALPGTPANTGEGLADRLVPFRVEDALLCSYRQPPKGTATVLTGVLRLAPAEAASVAEQVNAGLATPPEWCTADIGVPFVLRAGGGGRAVTLTLQPYGCGEMTNGTKVLTGKTQFLRDLREKVDATSDCPRGADGDTMFAADPGPTLLPADTTRLLLCAYRQQPRAGTGWDAAVEGEDARSLVRTLNSSPVVAAGPCTAEGGSAQVVVVAVAPDRVKRVLGQLGNCRAFLDGSDRRVRNEPVVRQLLRLAQQR